MSNTLRQNLVSQCDGTQWKNTSHIKLQYIFFSAIQKEAMSFPLTHCPRTNSILEALPDDFPTDIVLTIISAYLIPPTIEDYLHYTWSPPDSPNYNNFNIHAFFKQEAGKFQLISKFEPYSPHNPNIAWVISYSTKEASYTWTSSKEIYDSLFE